jgi:hypothetical protein
VSKRIFVLFGTWPEAIKLFPGREATEGPGRVLKLVNIVRDAFSRFIANIASVNLIVEANMRNSAFLPGTLTDVLTSSDRWVFRLGNAEASRRGRRTRGSCERNMRSSQKFRDC